ncbi:cell division protein SepF [archaeon]|nr:cell division protein SepF [archaeon]
MINVKPLKDRDVIELKRAVNKLKKTCEAISGDIAGFGDEWIVATPNFAQIWRAQMAAAIAQQQAQQQTAASSEF